MTAGRPRKSNETPERKQTPHPLVESWKRALRQRNLSLRSIGIYEASANQYIAWAERMDRHALEYATKKDVQDWLYDYRTRGLSEWTVKARQVNLHLLFRWMLAEGEIETDPMAGMALPILEDPPKDVVSQAQMQKVLLTLKTAERWRDYALIALLYDTGMRIGETCAALVEQCNLDRMDLYIPASDAKGRKDRVVFFTPATAAALDRWWRYRARLRRKGGEYVVSGHQGRLSTNWATRLVTQIYNEHGIPHISAHDIRHTSASHLSLSGMPVAELSTQFGWAPGSPMPYRYTAQVQREMARKAHARYSPMRDFGRQ